MALDFEHRLVGSAVVYTARHPGAKPEQGIVTSVDAERGIVFVRYGFGMTSAGTRVDDLRDLKNNRIEL